MLWGLPPVLMIVGLGVALAFDVPLAGDPKTYQERIAAIEAGGVPYVDPVFEHLPAMLIPMYTARLVAGTTSIGGYTVVFGAMMAACVSLTGMALLRSSPAGSRIAARWIVSTAPLMPFVVFRTDPFVVLLATLALMPTRRRWVPGVLAVLAKGWPAVLAVIEWRRGHRRAALGYAVAGLVAFAILTTGGFQETQGGSGLQAETLFGSIAGLTRSISGSDLNVVSTTTAYIDVIGWWRVGGPAIALVVAMIGILSLRGSAKQAEEEALVVSILVIAVIFASPLFSAQYLLWIGPFLAFSERRAVHNVMLAVNMLALVSVIQFADLFKGSVAWWSGAVVRNLLLIGLVELVRRDLSVRRSQRTAGEVDL